MLYRPAQERTRNGADLADVPCWAALAIGGACAAGMLADIYLAGHRQRMPIMEAVWPINALYLGPLAVWAYRGTAGTSHRGGSSAR